MSTLQFDAASVSATAATSMRRWVIAMAMAILAPLGTSFVASSPAMAAGGEVEGEESGSEEPAPKEEGEDPKKPTKRKKKHRRKKDVHSAQANDPRQKYRAEVTLLSDLEEHESTSKSAGGGSTKDGYGQQDIAAKALFVLTPSILAGPQLDYAENTVKSKDDTTKTSDLTLRLVGKYLFGNVDKDDILGFVMLNLGYGQGQSAVAGKTDKTTRTIYGVGGGLHYFLDADVALTAEFTYDTGSQTVSGGGSGTVTEIHFLKIGFSLFL